MALRTRGKAGRGRLVKYLTKYAPNMAYRVDLTPRAGRDPGRLYGHVHADDSESAVAWFNGLETLVYSLDKLSNRGVVSPESKALRHLLYGDKPHVYRIVYRIHEAAKKVRVLHVRQGALEAFA